MVARIWVMFAAYMAKFVLCKFSEKNATITKTMNFSYGIVFIVDLYCLSTLDSTIRIQQYSAYTVLKKIINLTSYFNFLSLSRLTGSAAQQTC